MITRTQLVDSLNDLLDVTNIKDFCPNGLQVQGRDTIKTIVTGVSANLALIQAAIEKNADAIIVHHGYFWQGESPTITGIKQQRLQALLKHDINLLTYHVPLDVHLSLGNNIQLAKRLEIENTCAHDAMDLQNILWVGALSQPILAGQFAQKIQQQLNRSPLHIGDPTLPIQKIAWCTGGGQKLLLDAAKHNVDAYISGEISEQTTHEASESGIHYFAAGHHATERYGVKALGEYLANEHPLSVHFVDIENPV